MQPVWTPPLRNTGIKGRPNFDCFFQGIEAAAVIARYMTADSARKTDLKFPRTDAIDARRQGGHFRLRSRSRRVADGKNAPASQANKQCLDSRQGGPKVRRDVGHGATGMIHRSCLGLINLVGVMSGTKSEIPDRNALQTVLLVCDPFKIFEAVIRSRRVFVVDHMLLARGGTKKRERDQSMNRYRATLAISAKANGRVSIDEGLIDNAAFLAHASSIADFVVFKSMIKNHGLPSLCAHAFYPHSIADAA